MKNGDGVFSCASRCNEREKKPTTLRALNFLLSSGDDGSTTILAAGICAVLTSAAFVVLFMASEVGNSHKARSAAEMSAFSAASALMRSDHSQWSAQPNSAQAHSDDMSFEGTGNTDACTVAARIAQLNGAQLEQCFVDESDVEVSVSVEKHEARARAGPDSSISNESDRQEQTVA